MQPNDPYQQPQVPHDYLNQIAAPQPVKTMSPLLLWGLIGGLLVAAILILVGVSSISSGPSTSSLASVGARFAALQTVSEEARDDIQSSELRSLNSTLILLLTNTNREMTEPLKSADISLKDKKDKTLSGVTADTEALTQRLEDARLNAVYDRTYAREMLFQLRTLRTDMISLYKSTKDKDLKATLDTTDRSLKPIVDGLSSFNAT